MSKDTRHLFFITSPTAHKFWLLVCLFFSFFSFPGPAGLGSIHQFPLFTVFFIPGAEAALEAAENLPPHRGLEPVNWHISSLTAWAGEPSLEAVGEERAGQSKAVSETMRRGEIVMKALAAAYPDCIGPADYVDEDWTIEVLGVRFYYAQGRLLPEELRNRAGEYDPQPFYPYAAELPPWREPAPEEAERLRNAAGNRQAHPPKRSQHFYDTLWQARTREESYKRIKTVRFLDRNILVHQAIADKLILVEKQILDAAKTDAPVQQWINSLNNLSGWNWRSIADTQSRSFHAYGIAIDLLPKSRQGLETYWLWTAEYNSRWWAVPYERRLHPPDKVIKAFEAYGFIWGGKWLFYDTMHFEYRPEILLLSAIDFLRS